MQNYFEAMRQNYPNFMDCTIQTFTDDKSKKGKDGKDVLARKIIVDEKGFKEAEELNKKGAGIFFSVNSMAKGERAKEFVTGVNAWVCEIDGMPKSTQEKIIEVCPLKPSMIIESNASYHMYWFADDDAKIHNWVKVCSALRNFFDGDPTVAADTARILRLPGFFHKKDPENPFEISVKEFDGARYSEDQMLMAYPDHMTYTEKQEEAIKKEKKVKEQFEEGDFWERVKAMDTRMVLEKLSGDAIVGSDIFTFRKNSNGTEQIVVNDKSTGCWIDKEGKIGSTTKGGPHRTNWVFWYGLCDAKELYKWIVKTFPYMVESKKLKKKDTKKKTEEKKPAVKKTVEKIEHKHKTFTFGVSNLDKRLGMPAIGDLCILAGYPGSGKSEFSYFMARANNKDTKILYFSLELSGENMKKRLARVKAGITKYQYQTGEYSDEQNRIMQSYLTKLNEYKNIEFVSYDSPPDIDTVTEEISNSDCELIFIDNIGNLGGDTSEIVRLSGITKLLRHYVNSNNVCIIGLHHMNKPGKNDTYVPGGIAKFRGTQKIIDDATLVWEVWRDQDPEEEDAETKSEVQLWQYKDTMGGVTGCANMKFNSGNYENGQHKPKENKDPGIAY